VNSFNLLNNCLDSEELWYYFGSMITKTKTSVSLSSSLLTELSLYNEESNVSIFVEKALVFYINELKRQERIQRDIKILKTHEKRFEREAKENLKFQADL